MVREASGAHPSGYPARLAVTYVPAPSLWLPQPRGVLIRVVALAVFAALPAAVAAGDARSSSVGPTGPYACPEGHPVKGYRSATAGHRLYFAPAHPFYEEASPDRCYRTEDDARRDGAVPAREPRPARPPSGELG